MVSLSKQLQATFFILEKKKKKGGDGAIVSYKLRELVKTADCDWQTGANKKQSDRGISEDINKTKKILKTDLITKKKNEKKKQNIRNINL